MTTKRASNLDVQQPDGDYPTARCDSIDAAIKDAIIRADAAESGDAIGERLDKLLSGIDSLTTACDGFGARLDALEKAKKADDDEDPSRTPGQPKRVVADDAYSPAVAASMGEAQSRADAVAYAWGERAPAPLSGETVQAYRTRLLRRFQSLSPDFKAVDLHSLEGGPAFDGIENRIYADLLAASARPDVAEGYLREIVKTDFAGRRMVEFHGQPKAWMDGFAGYRRRLLGIRNHG